MFGPILFSIFFLLQSFEYEKAVAGAYTYLQWNPDDEIMQNNLDYYRNLHGITEEHLVDLEEQLHHVSKQKKIISEYRRCDL